MIGHERWATQGTAQCTVIVKCPPEVASPADLPDDHVVLEHDGEGPNDEDSSFVETPGARFSRI